MEVRNHIVLFLDILGYSSLITSCKDSHAENRYLDKVHSIMSNLSEYIEKRNVAVDQKSDNLHLTRFKSLLFSDNILFFAPYEDETDMQNLYMNLLYGLSAFLIQYVKEDIFFRGGITKGNLFYDEKLHFVFGSGLVNAYLLESKVAKYPRIVIDKELKPSPILVGIDKDEEETWYLDYLSLGHSLICYQNKPKQNYEHFLICLEEQKSAISRAYQKYKENESVLPKYQWLAKYHNEFCERHKLNDYIVEIDL